MPRDPARSLRCTIGKTGAPMTRVSRPSESTHATPAALSSRRVETRAPRRQRQNVRAGILARMPVAIEVKKVMPRQYVGIRRTVKHDGLGPACAEILSRVAEWLASQGKQPAGGPI